MGNSSPRITTKGSPVEAPNLFELLPLELHEVIGGFVIGSQPVRINQILGYVLVAKAWSQTVFSGPIRLIAFNKHRISLDMLEKLGSFDRLSFCLDLRTCQRLGDDEDFLDIMAFPNIYELDLRGIEFKYDINPDLGHLTSLRRLAISQYKDKPASKFKFISNLTRLTSLIIRQDGFCEHESATKLDVESLSPLTNLKELAIHQSNEDAIILDPITKLVSLKALILNCGGYYRLHPSNFTSLTNLQELCMRGAGISRQEEIQMMSSIKWQTSLQRIYYGGCTENSIAEISKLNTMLTDLPEKKFKVGETFHVLVFNSSYGVGFY